MELVKRNAGKVAGLGSFLTLALTQVAGATGTSYDLSGATSGITDQVTAVLTTVLPVAGGLIALFIGWKVLRRMVKA